MEKKLQVRHLRISFRTTAGKVQAVRDISFDLHKGETMAIVGESGSGKSVTSKAILGILAGNAIVEGGEILYDGQDLLKIGEDDFYRLRGDKIAMIFQDPLSSLNPIMRIGKQLTEAMLLKGKEVWIDRDDATLPEGRHFIADLIGLEVRDAESGAVLGSVAEVLTPPAHEVYVVKGGEHEYMIPAVDAFLAETNVEGGYIRVRLIEGLESDV